MRRRDLIGAATGLVTFWPLGGAAQQPKKPLIGYLSGGSASFYAAILPSFREGLGDSGYVEGKNVAIEYRWALGLTVPRSILALADDVVE